MNYSPDIDPEEVRERNLRHLASLRDYEIQNALARKQAFKTFWSDFFTLECFFSTLCAIPAFALCTIPAFVWKLVCLFGSLTYEIFATLGRFFRDVTVTLFKTGLALFLLALYSFIGIGIAALILYPLGFGIVIHVLTGLAVLRLVILAPITLYACWKAARDPFHDYFNSPTYDGSVPEGHPNF